jgi:hypothetical protein
MNALAGKFISDQNRVVIVEGPDKEKDKLPDEKTILHWIKHRQGKTLPPMLIMYQRSADEQSAREWHEVVPSETTDELFRHNHPYWAMVKGDT